MHTKSQQVDQDHRFVGLETIFKPLAKPLSLLNDFLNTQINFFEPELQDLVRYSLEHKGKRIRPMLVFYSAWKNEQEISENLVKLAAIIELTHLATLVHDDILDEAVIRHNIPTIFNGYGPKIAVLLGDALFAHALVLAAEFESQEISLTIAQSIRRVCAGEIKQTFHSSKDTYTLEDYYRVIDLKTAELFHVSCLLGARLGGFSEDYVSAVGSFGRDLGIMYQLYDDLVDVLESEKYIGKTLGTDFASGKHTLPTLRLIDKLSSKDRFKFLQGVKDGDITFEDLKSMLTHHDVFSDVFDMLNKRIENADLSIANYSHLPSFSYLMKVRDLLSSQVRRLQEFSLVSPTVCV